MSNYTPGPWEWDGDDNNLVIRPRRITEDNEVSVIAVLPLESYEYLEDWSECSWSAEGEANARLIAAAPEMVDKFREALRIITTQTPQHKINEFLKGAAELLRRIKGEEETK